jgi:integrase
VRDGVITLDNEKTGMRVTIPILPALRVTLDAGPVGDLAFIAQRSGASLTKKTLGNAFRAACKAAGIVGKSAHGLRKAAATRAANSRRAGGNLRMVWRSDGCVIHAER